jgi:hypothetical protein
VESAGERAQQMIAGVGGDAVDNQLITRDSDGQRGSRFDEGPEALEDALLR